MTTPNGEKVTGNGAPWFMYWRPIGEGAHRIAYRWWAAPFAPLYRAWTSWRYNRCVKRLRAREANDA